MSRQNLFLVIVGVIALMGIAAGASAYMTRNSFAPEKPVVEKTAAVKPAAVKKETISWNQPAPIPAPQPARKCDDGNIVGAAIGAAGGGLVGHQFGKGKGKDLATIGGVIAGGAAGHQMIPTRNVLCK